MDRRKEICNALEHSMVQTIDFFAALDPEQLERQIYQDGTGWTTRGILAHLVTIEGSMHWLFNNILAGGEGSPRDFDVDRFNQSQTDRLEGVDAGDLIGQFRKVRQKTIAMVESMDESDLDRIGHHAFHGMGRLERFIRWAYEHAEIHVADIQNVLIDSNE